MTPAALDRVFGRGRIRMVTGDHVEVFREEALPGERRRYTKRFLATPEGDFRHWTEREWRILARLVGHGIGPVPDVVQFDRGAPGRPALVQTYDAGVTLDHWTTLLPVQRDGVALEHVFEDCAHWWALARHSLAALDAIHALQLVHLDLKADNLCIPVGPGDFDPLDPDACLRADFERIALIDFAFSLVSGERLESALPIARQTEYDYQSPRLLEALEQGSRGDLAPTRQLDWRCDLFSLAAMLRRYLPRPGAPDRLGWTAERNAAARALMRGLLEAHDAHLPALRPHAALIALAGAPLRDPDLADSLARGWRLGTRSADEDRERSTPITRIALPVAPLDDDPISIDPSDIESRAAARAPGRGKAGRRVAAALAAVAAAALAVPLLGEAWRAWAPQDAPAGNQSAAVPAAVGSRPEAVVAASSAAATKPEPKPPGRVADGPPPAAAPATANASPVEAPLEKPTLAAVPAASAAASEPMPRIAASPPNPTNATPRAPMRHAASKSAAPPGRAVAQAASPGRAGVRTPSTRKPLVVARGAPARAAPSAQPASRTVTAARPAPFPVPTQAKAAPAAPVRVAAAVRLPPAVGLAPLPAPVAASAPSRQEDPPPVAAQDFVQRAGTLMSTQIPRVAQRAERMVLRVLFTAANADEDGRDDDEVRRAAGAIRLAPEDPQLLEGIAAREARSFHDAARAALRRGDLAEAIDLQTRAFGADPVDAEIVGTLAFLRLRQGPQQAEAARRLALHALTLHDWKHPAGRIEDWYTLAIASALAGHDRDARNAWLTALALSGGSDRPCRAAIDAYALYGERLRSPVEAMLFRANAAGRPQRSRLCEWPPHWSVSAQGR